MNTNTSAVSAETRNQSKINKNSKHNIKPKKPIAHISFNTGTLTAATHKTVSSNLWSPDVQKNPVNFGNGFPASFNILPEKRKFGTLPDKRFRASDNFLTGFSEIDKYLVCGDSSWTDHNIADSFDLSTADVVTEVTEVLNPISVGWHSVGCGSGGRQAGGECNMMTTGAGLSDVPQAEVVSPDSQFTLRWNNHTSTFCHVLSALRDKVTFFTINFLLAVHT